MSHIPETIENNNYLFDTHMGPLRPPVFLKSGAGMKLGVQQTIPLAGY